MIRERGVKPKLRKKGFIPISIRLNDETKEPIDSVYQSIEEFVRQLAKLTRKWITKDEGEDSRAFKNNAQQVKIVISIREDYLARLEEMSVEIPGIFENRFRLKPLNSKQARKAIVEPAKLENNEQISSKAFTYEEEAIQEMLDFLCTRQEFGKIVKKDKVEPFQLQILCRHIEDSIEKKSGPILIKKEDLGGRDGMQKVLEEFYDLQINVFNCIQREKIRSLCEEGLISPDNQRLSLEINEINRRFKVSKKELDILVNRRLLRVEPRVGSYYYELSHDTMVKPIIQSRHRRFKKLEQMKGLYKELEKYLEIENLNKAEKIYNNIISIDKKAVQAYLLFGKGLLDPGKKIEVYEKAVKNGAKNRKIYYNLAESAKELKKTEYAFECYKKALDADMKFGQAYKGMKKLEELESQKDLGANFGL